MSNYNYLKIDFYGQFDNDSTHKLTYPEPYNPNQAAAMQWLNPIKDPRNMRTLFPTAQYGYKLHRDNNGVYYSLLTRYKNDFREGYVAITVMIGQLFEGQISGKTIFNLLNTLKTRVLDAGNYTAAAVEQCLRECQMPVTNAAPMRITPVSNIPTSALRTYTTNEEVHDIFLFPRQPDYSRFGDVFIINKAWCAAGVPAGISLLTTPLVRTYQVVKPAGVQCDDTTQTGKSLIITYTKPGFAPLQVPVNINGVSNQYVKYEGSKITILQPADLPFKQRVNVVVKVNGRTYSDGKVTATLGQEPLQYASQVGAYSAEVNQTALSGANVQVSVSVDDPTLVNRNQAAAMASQAYAGGGRRRRYDDYDDDDDNESSIKKWMLPLIAFLAGALIFGAVAYFLMRDDDSEPVPNSTPGTEQTADADAADLAYMKQIDTWDLTRIKSSKWQDLFSSIMNGEVGKFMNLAAEYNNLSKDKRNGHITNIYNLLSQNPQLQDQAASVFQNAASGNSIDLAAIDSRLKELAGGGNTNVNTGGGNQGGAAGPSPAHAGGGAAKPAGGGAAKPAGGGAAKPAGGGAAKPAGGGAAKPAGGGAAKPAGGGAAKPAGGGAAKPAGGGVPNAGQKNKNQSR